LDLRYYGPFRRIRTRKRYYAYGLTYYAFWDETRVCGSDFCCFVVRDLASYDEKEMKLLQINDETLSEIKRVIDFAVAHKVSESEIKLKKFGDLPPDGDNPDYVVHIHQGFRVVYSQEEQKCGLCHHLSVSHESGELPPVPTVEEILKLFHMNPDITSSITVWFEEYGTGKAVSILQLVDENVEKN
jgi:hypothetical protein